MKAEDLVADKIYWAFRRAQALKLEESGGDRTKEIHVTDLVYPCLRRAWYGKKYPGGLDSRLMGILWSGVVGHDAVALNNALEGFNELPVEYRFVVDGEEVKVVGRVDDVVRVGNEWVIVDKKFVNTIPREVREHHKLQVLFYAVMITRDEELREQINPIRWGSVLYVEMDREGKMNPRPFVFRISGSDIAMAEEILKARAMILWRAMRDDEPPPRVRTWLCDGYCPYLRRCALDGD